MSKILEIGPGRGDFLFFLAEQNPDATVVGVEYKKKRHDKLVIRRDKRGLTNVELLLANARLALPSFGAEEFDSIFILFSDPWPKKRHAKHRLFQPAFVGELLRVLKPEGRVYVAHDDPKYVAQIKDVFQGLATSFVYRDEGVEFTTFYADKWKKEGRLLWSFCYQKRGIPLGIPRTPCSQSPAKPDEYSPSLGGPHVNITLEESRDLPEPAAGSGL